VFWPRRTKTGVKGVAILLRILSTQDLENASLNAVRYVEDKETKGALKELRRELLDNARQVELLALALRDPDPSHKTPDGKPGHFAGPNELRGLPAEDLAWLWTAYSDFELAMSPIQRGITDAGGFNELLKKLAEEAELDPLAFCARGMRLSFTRTMAALLIDAAMGKSLPSWLVNEFSTPQTSSSDDKPQSATSNSGESEQGSDS
jgi:hypothetical protein